MIYGAINRFSKDVNITLDYRAFDNDCESFAANANNEAVKKFAKNRKGYLFQHAIRYKKTGSLKPVFLFIGGEGGIRTLGTG
ncbi:MAG: hypothetical protein KZQ58_07630 [gamma proteobacterium symbiont of Bathyaustriella thionipta]|nr:hypothetical protein [gamma proteobacterium symbiont of Bathyaustriella thionipta]